MGLGPADAFWRCTPRSFDIQVKAAIRRLKTEARSRLSLAWHSAYLQRVDKFPSHKDVIGPDDEPKRLMEPAEIRLQMSRWRFAVAGLGKAQTRPKPGGRHG